MILTLDVIANAQKLFPQLNALKGATTQLAGAADTAGKAYERSFALGEKKAKDFAAAVNTASNAEFGSLDNLSSKIDALSILKQHAEESKTAVDGLDNELRGVAEGINQIAIATLKESAQFNDAHNEKHKALQTEAAALQKLIDLSKTPAGASGQLGPQIAAQTRLVQGLTAEIKKQRDESNVPGGKGFEGTKAKVVSLTSILRQAKAEAFAMQVQFGEDSPEAIAAQRNVANLSEQLNDLNDRVKALNPEAKFQAFSQLASGIAGGFSVATGALALFGLEGENVQKTLFRVQAALAVSQGINQIFGLKDAFKNLAVVLGLTTTAQKASNAAKTEGIGVTAGLAGAETAGNVVKGETVVANTAATTSTNGLSAAMTRAAASARAFTASLLSNPVILLVAALAGLAAVLGSVSDKAEETKDSIDELNKKFAEGVETDKKRLADLKERLSQETDLKEQILQRELEERRKAGATQQELDAFELKRRKQLADDRIDIVQTEIDAQKAIEQKALLEAEKLQKERELLTNRPGAVRGFRLGGHDKEAIAAKDAAIKSAQDIAEAAKNEQAKLILAQKIAEEAADADKLARENKLTEDQKKEFERRRDELLKLHQELLDGLDELTGKSNAAEIELATGQAKLDLQKEFADKEIDQFRETLIKKGQEEENARAKILGIQAGTFVLSEKQEAQFNNIRLAIQDKYQKDSEALATQYAITKASTLTNTTDRDLAVFEAEWKEREKILRAAGVSEEEIIRQHQIGTQKILDSGKNQKLDLENTLSKNVIQERKRGLESEVEFEKKKQIDLLQIDLETAEAKLKIAKETAAATGDNSVETQQAIANLEATIGQIKGSITKGRNELAALGRGKKLKLSDLLGVDAENGAAEIDAAAESIKESIVSIYNSVYEAQRLALEGELARSEKLIESYNEQTSALEQKLNREQQLQDKGYANNVRGLQSQIDKINQLKQKELENQKRIQKEQIELQKEQIVMAGIAASIQIVLAAAQTIEAWSSVPYVGWIVGIAAAAALVAEWIAISNQIKSLNNQAASLESGGEIGSSQKGYVHGKRHTQGGVKYIATDGSQRITEIEDGEFVTNRTSTRKYRNVLEAINKDRPGMLSSADLSTLLEGTGVELGKDVVNNVVEKTIIIEREKQNSEIARMDVVESELKSIGEKIGGIEREIGRERVTQIGDSVIYQKGNITTVVKK